MHVKYVQIHLQWKHTISYIYRIEYIVIKAAKYQSRKNRTVMLHKTYKYSNTVERYGNQIDHQVCVEKELLL